MKYMRHRMGLRGILRLGDDSDFDIKLRTLHHELYDSADHGEENYEQESDAKGYNDNLGYDKPALFIKWLDRRWGDDECVVPSAQWDSTCGTCGDVCVWSERRV